MLQAMLLGPDGKRNLLEPEEAISRIHSKFNIEKFTPDIWFPKSATYAVGYDPETKMSGKFFQMQVIETEFNEHIADEHLSFSD
ncbi:hypothetical protein JT359_19530 [Candidatus Poribacteria bacterium]|nr:hypothetical protein [Candidatus Poribacteria bacterium]